MKQLIYSVVIHDTVNLESQQLPYMSLEECRELHDRLTNILHGHIYAVEILTEEETLGEE